MNIIDPDLDEFEDGKEGIVKTPLQKQRRSLGSAQNKKGSVPSPVGKLQSGIKLSVSGDKSSYSPFHLLQASHLM